MVKKVDIYGKQAKKVYVEFSHQRLAALGITPLQIAESLRPEQRAVERLDRHERRPRAGAGERPVQELDDIRNVPIAAGGRLHQARRLHDHARLRRSADLHRAPQRSAGADARVTTMPTAAIVDSARRSSAVGKIQAELPYGVELERVADQPTVVSESIWEFERSLLEALAIVLAVSLISLGWRTGIVVGLSVPIVLGVVALVMLAMGWNLERVSLGSLIIALGLLVDDGIIAVEMMVVKMEEGWDAQGGRLFLRRDRDAAADRRADHRRGLHADRILQVDHRRIRGRHLLDRRHGRAVLVGRLGVITPYLAVKMLPKDFGKHPPRRRSVRP